MTWLGEELEGAGVGPVVGEEDEEGDALVDRLGDAVDDHGRGADVAARLEPPRRGAVAPLRLLRGGGQRLRRPPPAPARPGASDGSSSGPARSWRTPPPARPPWPASPPARRWGCSTRRRSGPPAAACDAARSRPRGWAGGAAGPGAGGWARRGSRSGARRTRSAPGRTCPSRSGAPRPAARSARGTSPTGARSGCAHPPPSRCRGRARSDRLSRHRAWSPFWPTGPGVGNCCRAPGAPAGAGSSGPGESWPASTLRARACPACMGA